MIYTKKEFTKDFAEIVLEALVTAPRSQLAPKLKQEAIDFKGRIHTLQQSYDFCNYIYKQPEPDASSFVKVLCNVTKYYIRPE